jgi:HK97 family phage major capsid protein
VVATRSAGGAAIVQGHGTFVQQAVSKPLTERATMPPTLVDEYTELRTEALAITDKALSEERQLTDDEAGRLAELVTGAKTKQGEIERQKTAAMLIEQTKGLHAMDDPGDPMPAGGVKADLRSPGTQFIESHGYKAMLEQYPAGVPDSADPHFPPVMIGSARGLKTLTYVGDNSTAGGSTIPGVPPDFRGFVSPFFYNLGILDVVTHNTTSSELVEFVREDETARVNAAAPVPEAKATSGATYTAAAKPESAVKWVRVATPVRTIATWIPITTKALSDVPQIQTLIDTYLQRYLSEAVANQIVNGDGTGENLLGILPQAVAGAATTDFASLRGVQAQAELNGVPNAWIMNPTDVAKIDTAKDGQQRFYGNGPFSTGPRTLWGLPVVTSRNVPAGTVLVGDFNQCIVYDREQANVQTGTINDQFTHNMRTILAEERLAFGIMRPQAIYKTALTW